MADADVLAVLREESPVLLPGIGLSKLTEDQWQWIKATEEDYKLVLNALSLYFGGQELPSLGKPSDNRWLENQVIYYTRLYELIQLCWKSLKANRTVLGTKEELKLQKDITPGMFLAFLLRCQFLAQVDECLQSYSEFCVSEQRRFLENLGDYPGVKAHQDKELKAKSRRLLRSWGNFYNPLLVTLKVASTQASRSRQGSTLRKALARFEEHVANMREASLKGLRTRSPYQWKNGDFHLGGFS